MYICFISKTFWPHWVTKSIATATTNFFPNHFRYLNIFFHQFLLIHGLRRKTLKLASILSHRLILIVQQIQHSQRSYPEITSLPSTFSLFLYLVPVLISFVILFSQKNVNQQVQGTKPHTYNMAYTNEVVQIAKKLN